MTDVKWYARDDGEPLSWDMMAHHTEQALRLAEARVTRARLAYEHAHDAATHAPGLAREELAHLNDTILALHDAVVDQNMVKHLYTRRFFRRLHALLSQ